MTDRLIIQRSLTVILSKALAVSTIALAMGCTTLVDAPTANAQLGLPTLSIPPDNPQSLEKIALGRKIFLDTRFSADGRVSCASCHQPERAFTDGLAVARGLRDQAGTRNTPSLLNVAYAASLFWDGRRARLEDQAQDPFVNPLEHGLSDHEAILRTMRGDRQYLAAFRRIFGADAAGINLAQVTQALASFERSLLAGDSPFDRYYYGGNKQALSAAAIQGLEIFGGKGRCQVCHTIGDEGASFSDNQYHRLGIGHDRIAPTLGRLAQQVAGASPSELDRLIIGRPEIAALGRFAVTRRPADIGKFRTPSLRNVALTAPYMHDGSVASLEAAVELEIYYRGIEAKRPLLLSVEEKKALVVFLQSLTSADRPTGDE